MFIVIVSLPRSGSSALSQCLIDSNIHPFHSFNYIYQNRSELNKKGYHEDVGLNLLNDNLIRLRYGKEYNFIYNKNLSADIEIEKTNVFEYDIHEETLEIPNNYSENLDFYTGHEWDVWGLTRMLKNQKWYRCYEKFKVESYKNIFCTKANYERMFLENSKNIQIFIKDPRLVYNFDLWNFPENSKFIVLNRDYEKVLDSMRNHYGSRLFTNKVFDGYKWNSNHFNYKVRPQKYENFISIYENYLNYIKNKVDFFEINFDKKLFSNQLVSLSKYLKKDIKFTTRI